MNPFANVAGRKTKRSKFDLSHEKKLSCNFGELIPIYLQEVVPGDSFKVNTEVMLRMAPMTAPVMHRLNTYVHYFFVPNRIIWDQWEDFITGGRDGLQNPAMPTIAISEGLKSLYAKGRLPDYLGIPAIDQANTVASTTTISALPFRAYQEIYMEYYRDSNLEEKVPVDTLNASDLTTVRRRAFEKDYFTSALPWAQRGASVLAPGEIEYSSEPKIFGNAGQPVAGDVTAGADGRFQVSAQNATSVENIDSLNIDINELRKSVRLQEWLERTARGGYRYIEQILSHFGVRSSDARLQRPEYLGGGRQPVVISEVLNTAGSTELPQGNMAGHGISVGVNNTFKRSFEEHGFIIGIMSVLPKTAYQQGVNKLWTRQDKFDYYFPEFAQLGEQEVKNSELFFDEKEDAPNNATFGYQARYAEYKYQPSLVAGDFRDNLDHWHLGRVFSSRPVLNQSFVQCYHGDFTRIWAVEDASVDHLWISIYNDVSAIRPMPYFNNPTL